MSASGKPHIVAWVRQSRLNKAAKQIEAAERHGAATVYVDGEHEVTLDYFLTRPRPGEIVGVSTLDRLGRTRDDLRAAIMAIFAKRATILEFETGRAITNEDELNVALMTLDAVDEIARDQRALTKRQAKEFGARGGKAKAAAVHRNRMPEDKARPIWKAIGPQGNEERINQMPGWTVASAYRVFGARGAALGRPKKRRVKQKK